MTSALVSELRSIMSINAENRMTAVCYFVLYISIPMITVSLTQCRLDQPFLQITATADLTVLMSAVPQGDPEPVENGTKRMHRFLQKIPIQSYLIAIAAGKLESRKIGPR